MSIMAKKTKKKQTSIAQMTGERGSWNGVNPVTKVVPSRKNKPKRESNQFKKELKNYY